MFENMASTEIGTTIGLNFSFNFSYQQKIFYNLALPNQSYLDPRAYFLGALVI